MRWRQALLWNNLITTHHRWMATFLRRRGWVVFYLDERVRFCVRRDPPEMDGCWLRLYQEGEQRGI
jgi:hypothetical protein